MRPAGMTPGAWRLRQLVGEWAWLRVKQASGRAPEVGPAGLRDLAHRDARAERAIRRLPLLVRPLDLTDWAWHFKTDKWGGHWYTPHYERHLRHLRRQPITLLEIGVGGYDLVGEGGASLRMWERWLPRARIVGLDIEDKRWAAGGRIHVHQGNQVDATVLRAIVAEHGPIQVVIDDGSHRPEHIRETFRLLFPLLPDGAIYAIEDTQTSYWPAWGGSTDIDDPATTIAFVKDLLDGLHHEEMLIDRPSSEIDRTVRAVHCYHNLVVIEKGDNSEGTNKAAAAGDF